MKAVIVLFFLVAVAAAEYSEAQRNEVLDDIVHEALPALSVDWNCIKDTGVSSAGCITTNLSPCKTSGAGRKRDIALCLVKKCGGNLVKLLLCINI